MKAVICAIGSLLAVASFAAAEQLPEGYKAIEYIESTKGGGQFIDTDYTANGQTEVVFDAVVPERGTGQQADDIWMTFAMPLYLGTHTENPDDGQLPQSVRFCDYASAGNEWTPTNVYRTWFPIIMSPADEMEE